MTSEAHITTIDPEVAGRAALPSVPDTGLVLAHVPASSADVCAWHLLEFARRWRDEERRIHLCDACVETPVLHHAADVENAEGVTDAILYGSSLERISVPLEKGVMLTTAGTVVGDGSRVLDHPRWASIAAAVRDGGGLLVVAVPSDAAVDRLRALADAVVRFVPGGIAETDVDDTSSTGHAGSEPVSSPDTGAHPDDGATPPTAESDRAVAAGDRLIQMPAAADGTSGPPSGGGQSGRSGSRGLRIFFLLVVVLLGVLGAGFLGFVEIPGITPIDVDSTIDFFPLR